MLPAVVVERGSCARAISSDTPGVNTAFCRYHSNTEGGQLERIRRWVSVCIADDAGRRGNERGWLGDRQLWHEHRRAWARISWLSRADTNVNRELVFETSQSRRRCLAKPSFSPLGEARKVQLLPRGWLRTHVVGTSAGLSGHVSRSRRIGRPGAVELLLRFPVSPQDDSIM
jgi:hypothetical protein